MQLTTRVVSEKGEDTIGQASESAEMLQRVQLLVTEGLDYKRTHFVFFGLLTWRAALVAVSKTSRTPSFVLAEHSRYP